MTPLPEPDKLRVWGSPTRYYTDEQMKAYGAAEYARAIEDATRACIDLPLGSARLDCAEAVQKLGATP